MGAKGNYFRTNRPDASTGQRKQAETATELHGKRFFWQAVDFQIGQSTI